jgi:hypothetical protein
MASPAGLRGAGIGGVVCVLLGLTASGCTQPRADSVHAPDAVAPQTPAACGRVSARGTALVCADGSIFRWNGVTAFALLEQLAHGRGGEADAYMRWSRATGFNLVRVLATADVLFKLAPEEGRRHLDALFTAAAGQGLYVEIVAIADSARLRQSPGDLRNQVAAVGRVASAHANAIVQIANEHYHPTQVPDLHDPATLTALAALIPSPVLYTESASADDTAERPQGEFITRHLSRGGAPAEMTARLSLLGALAASTGKPVVNGEPIGAGERRVPGRRLTDPRVFRELARRTVGAGLAGGTFHCEDGMYARVPGPVQQACARAWVDGMSATSPPAARRP